MFLEWDPKLETGVAQVDAKHRGIFDQLNNLMEAMNQGKGKAEVGPLLDFLGDYVETHFKEEEEAMEKAGYPDLAAHRSHHIGFMVDFMKLKGEFDREGPTLSVLFAVQRRAADWVLNHIKNVDLKFARFLHDASSDQAPAKARPPRKTL